MCWPEPRLLELAFDALCHSCIPCDHGQRADSLTVQALQAVKTHHVCT